MAVSMVITFPGSVDLVDMNAAVNATWRAIRTRHRGKIPAALVTIVPGAGLDGGLIDWDTAVIQLPARTVADGPEAILAYLLHQAAHGWAADARSRWHSATFRDRATALQLAVKQDPKFGTAGRGWSVTEITDEAVDTYGDQIGQLAAASADWEPPAPPADSPRQSQRNGIVAVCACPGALKIRIRGLDAAAKLAAHPIRCDICGELYQPV